MNNNTNTELQEVFIGIRDIITRKLSQRAKDAGISLTHIEAIKYIGKKGEVTMKELAARLNITPPSASTLVDTLIEKDLIERHTDKSDRRIVRVVLRPKTHKMILNLNKEVGIILEEIFSSLDEKDKKQLVQILRKCL